MRNATRRSIVGLTASAVGAMALVGMPSQAVAVEGELPSTPTAYVSWLEGKGEPGAAETIAQFKALSQDRQNQFLDYLNPDPPVDVRR
ncbi:hypothetical protein ABZ705_33415 [Streptomyces sp. NPDC006984]|uniref:hypothetical protein n=1 Tax=Streptomyces sp. NPDC006984 TaxID=3155463 RepID=UPI0033E06388